MNREEKVVFKYLAKIYDIKLITYEPEGLKKPPDFVINSAIAVEVRRLNHHYSYANKKVEGLDNLSIPLFDAFREVLESLNSFYKENSFYEGLSYWVDIDYQRPLNSKIGQVKKEMIQVLKEFLSLNISNFPYQFSVNSEITFTILLSGKPNGKLFRPSGGIDNDAGGNVISVHAENILHCIKDKSAKLEKCLNNYEELWLYLLDNIMMWNLNTVEVNEVIDLIKDKGNFNKIIVLSYDGKSLLATIS